MKIISTYILAKFADNYTIHISMGSDNLYKKVEITGIDTHSLTTLTDREREELIQKMKNGDKKARDKLVIANLKLVLSVIQRVNIRTAEPDDLFQVGCIGLI